MIHYPADMRGAGMCAQKSPAPVSSHPVTLASPQGRIPVMHGRHQTVTRMAEGGLPSAGHAQASGTENVYENIGCWRRNGGSTVMSRKMQSSENEGVIKEIYSLA